MLKPLKFRKDSRSPRMTQQIQILQHRLECFSRDKPPNLELALTSNKRPS